MSRERFLDDLAAKMAKSLPPDEAAGLVAEARQHLEDSFQARVELGSSREEAEREALRAFGDARTVTSASTRGVEASRYAARLRWLGWFYAALALYSVAALLRLDIGIVSLAPLGPLLGFAFASFRARRPAPVPIVVGGFSVSAVLATLFGLATGQASSIPAHGFDLLVYPAYTGALDVLFGCLGTLVFAARRRLSRG